MLELTKIKETQSDEYAGIEQLLVSSFPTDEYRELNEQQENVRSNKHFELIHITYDGEPVGFVSIWNFDQFSYIEHFATYPHMRNKGFGSIIMKRLQEEQDFIVLEAELPTDTLKERRISFYKRLGFEIFDNEYIQPAYKKTSNSLRMNLMYWNNSNREVPFQYIRNKIYTHVYNL